MPKNWDEQRIAEANRDLLRRDESAFLRQAGSTPCQAVIERAEGIWLHDVSGHRFIDMHGNNVHHIGYGHPRLIEAVMRQMRSLPFTPRRFTDAPAVELAERLRALWPGGQGKVLFATGGSDAMEIAMKLARIATGRYKTVSFYGSYHGSGFGALSIGGRRLDRPSRLGPLLPGALHVPPFYRSPAEAGGAACDAEHWAVHCLDCIRLTFEHDSDIAAVIAEPIRSTPYVPPSWFWPEVRALCDRHGSLLIFDEIPTGLGKTGRMFASEHFGVRPDITVLGKALGGGMLPIAAVIAAEALDCAEDLTLGHYTHEKNPVTASAALATLDIIEDEDLVENAKRVGERALDRLRRMAERSPMVSGARGKGLLLAFDVRGCPSSGRQPGAVAASLARRLFKGGVSLSPSSEGVLSISAPLVIDMAQMDGALDLIEEALSEEHEAPILQHPEARPSPNLQR
ncbi:MAG: aspartate aminotransferase family protein [Parvibaculaceae bacterium]